MRARLYGKAQLDFITLFHSHYRSLILSAGTYKYITKRTVVLARLLEGMILIVVALLMMGRLQNYFEKEVALEVAQNGTQYFHTENQASKADGASQNESSTLSSDTSLSIDKVLAQFSEQLLIWINKGWIQTREEARIQGWFHCISIVVLIINIVIITSLALIFGMSATSFLGIDLNNSKEGNEIEISNRDGQNQERRKTTQIKKNRFRGILCFAIFLQSKLFYLPMIFIQLNGIQDVIDNSRFRDSFSYNRVTVLIVLNSISLISSCFILVFDKKFLALNIPSEDFAPQSCSASSNFMYLEMLAKIAPLVIITIDSSEDLVVFEIFVTFVLQFFLIMYLFFIPTSLDNTLTLIHFTLSYIALIIYFLGSISIVLRMKELALTGHKNQQSTSGYEMVYLVMFLALLIYSSKYYYTWRRHHILDILKKEGVQGIKHEFVAEHILLTLAERAEKLIYTQNFMDSHEPQLSEWFSEMVRQLDCHNDRCSTPVMFSGMGNFSNRMSGNNNASQYCVCEDLQEYINILVDSHRGEQSGGKGDLIVMTETQIQEEYSMLWDEYQGRTSYQSAIACFTAFSQNYHTRKPQSLQFKAEKSSQLDASLRMEALPAQQHNSESESILDQRVSINLLYLRRRVFSQIVRIICEELQERFPKSLKLYLLQCYIQAVLQRKPFQCLNAMRTYQSKNLTKTDRITKKINDLYILSRLDFIADSTQLSNSSSLQDATQNRAMNNFFLEQDGQLFQIIEEEIMMSNTTLGVTKSTPAIQKIMKKPSISVTNAITIERMIEVEYIQRSFDKAIEKLTNSALDFWQVFTTNSNAPIEMQANSKFDPQKALKHGQSFAVNMQALYSCFNQLESRIAKQDPFLYIKLARVLKNILNDYASYETLIAKIRSILEIRKLNSGRWESSQHGQSLDNAVQNENQAFMIVGANQGQLGYALMMNDPCRALLKRPLDHGNSAQFKINSLMPNVIANHHDSLLRKFRLSGESRIMNKDQIQLIKNSQDLLSPAKLFVKLHYSPTSFKFCFFANVSPLQYMSPFKNCSPYQVNQLIFLTISLQDGLIQEFSETFINLITQAGARTEGHSVRDIQDQIIESKKISIQEILPEFNIKEYHQHRDANIENGASDNEVFFEGIYTFDISALQGTTLFSSKTIFNSYQIQVRASIRAESYNQGQFEIGYVILAPMERDIKITRQNASHETANDLNCAIQSESLMKINQNALNCNNYADNQEVTQSMMLQHEIYGDELINNDVLNPSKSEQNEDGGSASGSQTASSTASTSMGSNLQNTWSYLKTNVVEGFAIPKSLKIVLQLVLFLFFVTISIASINLALNIQNKDQGVNTVITVRKTINRINFTSNSRLILRNLINMANGYEPFESPIIPDRWEFYSNYLSEISDCLKQVQNFLDNTRDYKFSDKLKHLRSTASLKLLSINGQSKVSINNSTMSDAINLYTSKLTTLNAKKTENFRGNLYLQNLKGKKWTNYVPTEMEQMIYFTVMNGNGVLREYNWVFTNQYLNDAKETSKSYQNLTMITTLVSILSIFVVLLIISPIISKTEERRYMALTFFLEVPDLRRHEFLQQIQDMRQTQTAFESRTNSPQRTSYSKQNVIQYFESSSEEYYHSAVPSVVNPASSKVCNSGELEGVIDAKPISIFRNKENSRIQNVYHQRPQSKKSSSKVLKEITVFQNATSKSNLDSIYQSEDKPREQKDYKKWKHAASEVVKNKSQTKELDISEQSSQLKDSKLFDNDQVISSSSINFPPSKKGDNQKKQIIIDQVDVPNSKKSVNQSDSYSQNDDRSDNHEDIINSIVSVDQVNQMKELQDSIQKQAYHQKIKSLITVLLTMIVFSAYFTGSYFMAIQNYEVTSQSVLDLNVILFKEACFENMITFMRENQIRNESVVLSEDNKTVASASLIKSCQDKEAQYLQLRRNPPSYLENAVKVMDQMEAHDICEVMFNSQEENKTRHHCQIALEGLVNEGVSHALAYMYRKALKIQRGFEVATESKSRDEAFLRKQLSDPETVEIVDTKMYIFSKPFTKLKDACMESVLNFFQATIYRIVALYTAFMALLVGCILGFFFFVFKRLRDTMFNTNLLLRIIPVHNTFEKETQQRLQNFFIT